MTRLLDVRVDDAGIFAKSRREVIIDVLFDGRRIFAFWLHRDSTPVDGGHLFTWPYAIRTLLDGRTEVTMVEPGSGTELYRDEVSLGHGEGRIAIVNRDGQPVSLDKSMRKVLTFDLRSADHVEPLLNAIDDVLATLKKAGIDAFLVYGSLLGAVREQHLLGHDSDADLGYVSKYENPVDVILESFRLHRFLNDAGYRVSRYSAAAFKVDVIESDGSVRGLDVFGGFMRDGNFHLMGEIRTPFRREWLLPISTVVLEGRQFPAPAEPERLLAATYGPSWRTPDPAFHFEMPSSTHRRLDGWFRGMRLERSKWQRFYSVPERGRRGPSALVRQVARREAGLGTLIDVGCGRGADVAFMAAKGVPSWGLDFCRRAFRDLKESGRPDLTLQSFNLLELRHVLAVSAILARLPGPRVMMARHLVDAIGPRARENLWRTGATVLREPGDRLYLEFCSRAGSDGYAHRNRVSVRSPRRVIEELEAAGATVLRRRLLLTTPDRPEASSQVCRIVATWSGERSEGGSTRARPPSVELVETTGDGAPTQTGNQSSNEAGE
jgi:hypothetical protein